MRTPITHALVALLSLSLAACSATRFAEVANLNDPRTVVDESASGRTITLRKGSALVIHLPMVAGDGNRWELAPLPLEPLGSPIRMDAMPAEGIGSLTTMPAYSGVLARLNPSGASEPPIVLDASKPSPVVSQGETVLRLRGVAPGTTTVQLDYRRADTPGAPASKSVRFDVAVVP